MKQHRGAWGRRSRLVGNSEAQRLPGVGSARKGDQGSRRRRLCSRQQGVVRGTEPVHTAPAHVAAVGHWAQQAAGREWLVPRPRPRRVGELLKGLTPMFPAPGVGLWLTDNGHHELGVRVPWGIPEAAPRRTLSGDHLRQGPQAQLPESPEEMVSRVYLQLPRLHSQPAEDQKYFKKQKFRRLQKANLNLPHAEHYAKCRHTCPWPPSLSSTS